MPRRLHRCLPPLVLLALVAMFTGTAGAQGERRAAAHASSPAVKQELTAVVDAQLAAFRANDYPKAYTFAAEGVQDMFPPENFATMVKTGYPIIANSAKATYGLAFDTGEEAVINVTVETADGRQAQYQYLLKKEKDAWKITGVSEIKSEAITV